MEENSTHYLIGTATKYVSLIAGSSVFITSDAPYNYIGAGVCGLFYLGGELLQKTPKDKELKNLEDKIKEIKK